MNLRVLSAFVCGMLIVVGLSMMGNEPQVTAAPDAVVEVPVIAGVVPPAAPTMPAPPEPAQFVQVSSGCENGVCSTPRLNRTITHERQVIRSTAVSSEGERVVSGRRVGRVATAPIRAVGRLLLRRR